MYPGAMPSRLHMDAVLTPTRSLPKAGLYLLLGALAVVNLAVGTLFLAMGAKPVPIFLGLDFLAVLIAFHVSYRQARHSERVQVSSDEVHVTHEIGRRRRTVWRSPTAFTRVSVDMRGEPETRVSLHLSGRSVVLAGRLSPQERMDFADALEAAIKSARAERYSH
ncbi:MAG: hypothetical protein JWO72_2057 [Caulobacteraceae bacterium]|nr:hypothetical protein [Caulobacteraceae bacterium]